MNYEVIIIGGGMAGLMAAKNLSLRGKKVLVLEAAARFGGRVNTVTDPAFDTVLEAGAEFIHGDLPLTLGLLNEAAIPFYKTGGEMVNNKNGQWQLMDNEAEEWSRLFKKMKEIKRDMPLSHFLEKYFPGEKNITLRSSVRHYAEGFDLADINTASTIALYNEWSKEEEGLYRVQGGYSRLTQYLVHICEQNGAALLASCIVKTIEWKKDEVRVHTVKADVFTGNKVIVTVPLKIVKNKDNETGAIDFIPAIPVYIIAAGKIGYGTVIKLFLQFSDAFWVKQSKQPGFIISDQVIPTWWTQLPNRSNMLTGWLGGPNAEALQNADEKIILRMGLESLANIFSVSIDTLHSLLRSWKIIDWSAMPFIGGAYSFATIETTAARKLLKTPLEETVYFAGEGIYETDAPGTVEAALYSGEKIADDMPG